MNGSECPAEGLQDENCMLSAAEVSCEPASLPVVWVTVFFSPAQVGERDALSAVRMMVSLLRSATNSIA